MSNGYLSNHYFEYAQKELKLLYREKCRKEWELLMARASEGAFGLLLPRRLSDDLEYELTEINVHCKILNDYIGGNRKDKNLEG